MNAKLDKVYRGLRKIYAELSTTGPLLNAFQSEMKYKTNIFYRQDNSIALPEVNETSTAVNATSTAINGTSTTDAVNATSTTVNTVNITSTASMNHLIQQMGTEEPVSQSYDIYYIMGIGLLLIIMYGIALIIINKIHSTNKVKYYRDIATQNAFPHYSSLIQWAKNAYRNWIDEHNMVLPFYTQHKAKKAKKAKESPFVAPTLDVVLPICSRLDGVEKGSSPTAFRNRYLGKTYMDNYKYQPYQQPYQQPCQQPYHPCQPIINNIDSNVTIISMVEGKRHPMQLS